MQKNIYSSQRISFKSQKAFQSTKFLHRRSVNVNLQTKKCLFPNNTQSNQPIRQIQTVFESSLKENNPILNNFQKKRPSFLTEKGKDRNQFTFKDQTNLRNTADYIKDYRQFLKVQPMSATLPFSRLGSGLQKKSQQSSYLTDSIKTFSDQTTNDQKYLSEFIKRKSQIKQSFQTSSTLLQKYSSQNKIKEKTNFQLPKQTQIQKTDTVIQKFNKKIITSSFVKQSIAKPISHTRHSSSYNNLFPLKPRIQEIIKNRDNIKNKSQNQFLCIQQKKNQFNAASLEDKIGQNLKKNKSETLSSSQQLKIPIFSSFVEIQVSDEEQASVQNPLETARFCLPTHQGQSLNQISQYKMLQSSNTSLGNRKQSKYCRSIYLPDISIQQFLIGPCRGKGKYGKVFMAIEKQSGIIVALKQIPKSIVEPMLGQFIQQLKLQMYLNSPYIVQTYGYFTTEQNIYIVMQYMQEGSLYELIKKHGPLKQRQAAQKFFEIGKGLQSMHQQNIIHRDIKPENIVITHGVCKICDFGWAVYSQGRRQTNCGTLDYLPPQILQGQQYCTTIDIWSLGVLFYEILSGKAPFYNVSIKQTISRIKTCTFTLPEKFSRDAKDLIQKLLKKQPSQRIEIDQILKHPFFAHLT